MTSHWEEGPSQGSGPPNQTITFGKSQGCYMSRGATFLLVVFMLSGLVTTGLIVYYFAPYLTPASFKDSKKPVSASLIQPRKGDEETVRAPCRSSPDTTDEAMMTNEKLEEPAAEVIIRLTTETSLSSVDLPSSGRKNTTEKSIVTSIPLISSTTEAETSATEQTNRRLPRALKPLHYLVKLQPFINGNFSIIGHVEVEMEALEPTSNITLHMADIITRNETIMLRALDDPHGEDLKIRQHEYDNERQFYVAHLEQELQPGHKYLLSMEFLGYLNDHLRGFYRSSYTDADGTHKWLAATQFQSSDARRAFPCFDEPGFKATFEVYLAREENMTSISNMPIAETLPVTGQEGWLWDRYNTTVPMSTYLVAFIVSDFAHMNSTFMDHVLFKVWAREEALLQAQYSLDIGPRILSHYEMFFNVSFPLPKLDMIALPDFAYGAMENWGLVTYRETYMLYDPSISSMYNKERIAMVISHELAHQWFGNLVTPYWWEDIWLNEGFANFVEYIGVDYIEPSWRVKQRFVTQVMQEVLGLDSLGASHPVKTNIVNGDKITYKKGSSVIRMMNHFLTEATFRKGLSNYLDAFKYDNAEQDDLWRHLTEAAHEDGTLPDDLTVKIIMDTWTLQMGYPVIKVVRSPDGTSATVSQERFLMLRKENSTDTHEYRWWVPLTYTTEDDPNFNNTQAQVWMKDSEAQLTIPSLPSKEQWVIFNPQETGYYRVNYDDHNWELLIHQLFTNHRVISTINRAQIIDDAMNLAKAGHLSYRAALHLCTYLPREAEYLPWEAALNNFDFLKTMFSRTSGYGAFKSYLLDILVPLYDSVGFEDSVSDPLLDQYKRQKAVSWACKLDHPDCLYKASSLFAHWMNNPDNNSIPLNLKSTVYCYAIAQGDEAEWQFAWDQYLRSNVGSEKAKLLSALGCTKTVWLLTRYLEMAFTPSSGIRKQDSYTVFAVVASNEMGRALAWDFLHNEWDRVYTFFKNIVMNMIRVVSRSFNTKQQLSELLTFCEAHAQQLSSAELDVKQVIENVEINVAWMRAKHDMVVGWLEKNGYSSKLRSHK
ncbi:aminopeptidase N-like isoform X2 [Panulirus ornatus]